VPPPGVWVTTVISAVPPAARSAAVTSAVNCVELRNVVASVMLLKFTFEPMMKLDPVRVTVVLGLPTGTEVGLMLVNTGRGLMIVKVCGADVPPPGVGVTTVMMAVPTAARSAAGITAVSWVVFTKVVVRAVVLKSTVAPFTKPLPVRVRVVLGLPKGTEVGLMEVSTGTGLMMAKGRVAEMPPAGAGLTMVIEALPGLARSAAGITAVSCVLLTKVVTMAVPLNLAVELATKLVPVRVMVRSELPADTDVILMLVSVGNGLLMVNV